MAIQALDFKKIVYYIRECFRFVATEATEKWSILYHASKETHGAPHGDTSPRDRDLFGQASGRGLGTQYQNDLRGDYRRQAPGQEDRQELADYAGSCAGVLREFAVRQKETVDRQNNSASSEVARPREADAAMDLPCHKYTLLRPRRQRLSTARLSGMPGLPSWAAGSGSG